jgi:ATP-dependent helicase/nuclease subunit B
VQQRFFERLRDEGALPVTAAGLERAGETLDAVVRQVAREHADLLAPAIAKVWEDGVTGVRADLREWLRRMSEDESGFVPWAFELSFGLQLRRDRDAHSRREPVDLDCGIQLRGSIDLVERRADGGVRITDHKTGKASVEEGRVIQGGESLQPVLYALAAEKLLPGDTVEQGRLYYCTSAGGFEQRPVPLDERARASARLVADTVDGALAEPFLPAAPKPDACRFCDYRVVCGPYEELRVDRKYRGHAQIRKLAALRESD